jgi:hypothetical protein
MKVDCLYDYKVSNPTLHGGTPETELNEEIENVFFFCY